MFTLSSLFVDYVHYQLVIWFLPFTTNTGIRYIEGSAWSVSEKYILACDSVSLLVKPHYYDFFTRGLMPVHHYWPVRNDDKCKSIKFAVDWGNSHKQKQLTGTNAYHT